MDIRHTLPYVFKHLQVNVLPRNYRLELKPDLTTFVFEGVLEITAEVEEMREKSWEGWGRREGRRVGGREEEVRKLAVGLQYITYK